MTYWSKIAIFFHANYTQHPLGKQLQILLFSCFSQRARSLAYQVVLVHSAKVCKNLHGYCVYCPLFNHSSSAYVTDGQTEKRFQSITQRSLQPNARYVTSLEQLPAQNSGYCVPSAAPKIWASLANIDELQRSYRLLL